MHQYRFTDEKHTYTRISKIKARGFYYQGSTNIAACPSKLRPGLAKGYPSHVMLKTGEDFDKLLNSFEYYNCNTASEYPMFYLVNERKADQ